MHAWIKVNPCYYKRPKVFVRWNILIHIKSYLGDLVNLLTFKSPLPMDWYWPIVKMVVGDGLGPIAANGRFYKELRPRTLNFTGGFGNLRLGSLVFYNQKASMITNNTSSHVRKMYENSGHLYK